MPVQKSLTQLRSFSINCEFCLVVTLLLSQVRFKITEEFNHETLTSPMMRNNKDSWFFYVTGNSERVKCVLRAFMVISSPVVSLVSTTLLLFGKAGSNPYYFIPWLFLTLKGLLLVQTDNLISIFKDMITSSNHRFGSQTEDLKWILFYFTFFLIDLIEAFSFCEIFDFFLLLWNRHPGYNEESADLVAVRKEIADIVENISKCSSIKSSKVSSGNTTEDDGGKETSIKGKSVKVSLKSEGKAFDERHLGKFWWNIKMKNESGENCLQKQLDLRIKMNTHSESSAPMSEKQDQGKLRNFSPTNVSVAPNPTIGVTGNKPEDDDYK